MGRSKDLIRSPTYIHFEQPTSCRRLRCPKGSRVITPSRKKWGNAGQDVRDRETIEERGNQKSPRVRCNGRIRISDLAGKL